MRKSRIGINNGLIERQTLAFVYGDAPGQLQGVLPENAGYGLLNFLRLFVKGIFLVFPFLFLT